jgi:transketolase N-terminal domain/subunit
MKDLFREMRAAGWKATGHDGNDARNLRNTMSNRANRFKNIGNNTWEAVQN